MRNNTDDLSAMTVALGCAQVAARQWLEAGFPPGDAFAYVRAGCFDVDRTAELRCANISASHIARLGLGWDYCAGKVALVELPRENQDMESDELPWEGMTNLAPQVPTQSASCWPSTPRQHSSTKQAEAGLESTVSLFRHLSLSRQDAISASH